MVQKQGQKRGRPRTLRNSEPASKKARTSSPAQSVPPKTSPALAVESPVPEKRVPRLPVKIADNRPLPALAEARQPTISDDDFQSIAASAVLQASLDRSRVKWVGDGILERYWVKPETGKNAKPPPPNNPEVKWQKHQGPCRIRIEPHILEVELYVEQKPKPPPVKQYIPPAQPYRPAPFYSGQQQAGGAGGQQRVLSPMQPPQSNAHGIHPAPGPPQNSATSQPAPPRPQQPSPSQAKKPPTDPVISMLASRASSDPVLKALMKEVANGNATQDQLKVFQAHIDELTKIINDKKKKEEEEQKQAAGNTAPARPPPHQQPKDGIRYEGQQQDSNRSTTLPQPRPYQPTQQQQQNATFRAPAPYQQPAPAPPPAPPAPQAVILAFTSPGSSEDRFVFPRASILESLSPQHLLASFIVTRRGSASADPGALDAETEYWQPVTLMVEVAYKREHFLDFIKKWVLPPDEVRKGMEETMKRCVRAPVHSLVMRLPNKGAEVAEKEEDGGMEIALPLPEPVVLSFAEKSKKSTGVKYARKKKVVGGDEGAGKKAAGEAGKAGQGVLVPGKEVQGPGASGKVAEEVKGATGIPTAEKAADEDKAAPVAAADKATDTNKEVAGTATAPVGEPPAAAATAPAVAAVAAEAPAESGKDKGEQNKEEKKEDNGEKTFSAVDATKDETQTASKAPAEPEDSGRPKRSVRKSARISEAA